MGSRIGIIFAFLLSVAAAGGAYFLYQGWVEERDLRGTVEAKYDQAKEKMLAVQSEKEKLKVESEQYKTQSDEYRGKAEAMQQQLAKLQEEQTRINDERIALKKQLEGHQELIAGLQKKVEDLDKKAKAAQQACSATPVDMKPAFITTAPQPFGETASPATSTVSAVEPEPSPIMAATAEEPVKAVEAPVKAVEPEPVSAPVPSEPVKVEQPAPAPAASAATETKAASKVLTVNRKFNFVVINLGLQDGLKMGDKLKVVKDGKDSATLQAEKLYDKFSAATIVEEDPKQQVAEGDEVRKV
ncbi:MAG TPA: hypothetical protein PLL75_06390 [Candidatus Omnitrophota bacterium]|nr:hypothetical protein [Candidatus Omnitrophota bacterium]HPS37337.1 hypothetical protein [Candidatus Omnitrophota bacterium]